MSPDLKTLSDEELMAHYQEGNESAFEALYVRHSRKVYGYLKSRLHDSVFADDVFQATFLKLHSSRFHYDPSFPFLPWLFTVCKSVMIDQIRKRQSVKEDQNIVAVERAEAPNPVEPTPLPSLSALPAMQQQAVVLRYSNDLSFEEIAIQLETSPSNVRKLVSRAIKQLKIGLIKGSKNEKSD